MDSSSSNGASGSSGASWRSSNYPTRLRKPPTLQSSLLPNTATRNNIFKDIKQLLDIFHQNKIPGPRLLRMRREFNQQIGRGAQATVFGPSPEYQEDLSACERASSLRQSASHWKACVIKSLRTGKDKGSAQQINSALSEVQRLCQEQLKEHPNVVTLTGWGLCLDSLEAQSLTAPLLILERAYCDLSLFIDCPFYRALSYETKCDIALQIGLGVSAIHGANISHGDLKPENILVFDQGGQKSWIAKICDFGSSRDATGEFNGTEYLGTTSWRPPEAFLPPIRMPLQMCDIFAYGLVVWSWFLGVPSSPIAAMDGDQIQDGWGEQHYFHQASDDIQGMYSRNVTQVPEDPTHDQLPLVIQQLSPVVNLFISSIVMILEGLLKFLDRMSRSSKNVGPFRAARRTQDFGPEANRILSVLGESLNDRQELRGKSPWRHFKQDLPVQQVQLPQRFRRQQNLKATERSVMGPTEPESTERSWTGQTRRVISDLKAAVNTALERFLVWFKIRIPLLKPISSRQWVYRSFFAVFARLLGPDLDALFQLEHPDEDSCFSLVEQELNSLRKLVTKHWRHIRRTTYLDHGRSPDATYALARIRSRFKRCCWENLFLDHCELLDFISEELKQAEHCGYDEIAAWALRNKTASDFQGQAVDGDFYNINMSEEFTRHIVSEDFIPATFRLLLLLDRNFYLGQDSETPGLNPDPKSVFQVYLEKLSLNFHDQAVLLCQHFQRMAFMDGATTESKFFYTGTLDDFVHKQTDTHGQESTLLHRNTSLHDAVRAKNYFAVEYLVSSGFNVPAKDRHGKSAYEVAYHLLQVDPDYRISEIIALLEQHPSNVRLEPRLPLGWEEILVSGTKKVFRETSIEHEVSSLTFKTPRAGLLQDRSIAIAERTFGVENTSDTYMLNPMRFLQAPRMLQRSSPLLNPMRFSQPPRGWIQRSSPLLNPRRSLQAPRRPPGSSPLLLTTTPPSHSSSQTDLRKPATESFFNDNWYRKEITSVNRPKIRATDDARAWYRNSARLIKLVLALLRAMWATEDVHGTLFLIFVPLTVIAELLKWGTNTRLAFSLLALGPLLTYLPLTIEKLAMSKDAGHRFNCSYILTGASDLVIGLHFISRHEIEFPLLLMVGNIVCSNLLVLGSSMALGGVRFHEQFLNSSNASTVLQLSAIGPVLSILLLVFQVTQPADDRTEQAILFLSRAMAIICLALSILYAIFAFHTHHDLWTSEYEEDEFLFQEDAQMEGSAQGENTGDLGGSRYWHVFRVMMVLSVALGLVYTSSTFYHAIAAKSSRLHVMFGVFGLPLGSKFWVHLQSILYLVSNNEIHATNRIVGHSIHMSLIVAPLFVLYGWIVGVPMSLRMDIMWTAPYALAFWMIYYSIAPSKANYLHGMLLVFVYVMFSIAVCLYVGSLE